MKMTAECVNTASCNEIYMRMNYINLAQITVFHIVGMICK